MGKSASKLSPTENESFVVEVITESEDTLNSWPNESNDKNQINSMQGFFSQNIKCLLLVPGYLIRMSIDAYFNAF